MGGLAKVMGGMGGKGGGGNPMDMLGGGGMPSPGGGGGLSALPIAGPVLEGVLSIPGKAIGAAADVVKAPVEAVSNIAPTPHPGG